ncbi:monovalent cation:proton antiporter-2 (CPA2) family protein [Oceanicella sp. SM1341]|uniref:monovalent cation:proton antiporter-2 (CPA2) family protein n=1 Tax=Oceanicella sp. SM1341 TaxID=1548889 RepID=UPI000E54EA7D|nr:monovalent cation:proton antiporter-2 (CPA2) family protein [Oceanicella sp. SM1341]
MEGILLEAILYLAAAVVAVPLSNRLGLGSVLGYLIAGVVIGPILGWAGEEATDIQHFAEFGVVMMLFLIGLELDPAKLWRMRSRLLGLGGLQITLTAGLITGALVLFWGNLWQHALAIALILALSSTAIVLQTLRERGWMRRPGGQTAFAILLFQDIAVIPIIALLPLLAMQAPGEGAELISTGSLVAELPDWARALVILAEMTAIIVGGRYLSRPVFRFIARGQLTEIFAAATLLMIIGIAWAMGYVGLTPALGAFTAGVALSGSEYRHEIESHIEPFKGLLLGLFFITVGAGFDLFALFADPLPIIAATAALMAVKFGVVLLLTRVFRLGSGDSMLVSLGLAQAGEFAFVLIAFSTGANVLPASMSGPLSLVVALSMLASPLLFVLAERFLRRPAATAATREADEIDETGTVIIAGIGRFGQIVQRMMTGIGVPVVVVDNAAERVGAVGHFGQKAYYGDPVRPEILRASGIADAAVLVVAIDDREKAVRLVQLAKHNWPSVRVLARAYDRIHQYELMDAGADVVIRETFHSALEAARQALLSLGKEERAADRLTAAFARHDARTVQDLYGFWDRRVAVHLNTSYVNESRLRFETLREVLRKERAAALRDAGAFDAPDDEAPVAPPSAPAKPAAKPVPAAAGAPVSPESMADGGTAPLRQPAGAGPD